MSEGGFLDALDAESFAHGLVPGYDAFGGAVGVETEHGFEAAPAADDGVGALGAQLSVLLVEAVAVGTRVPEDIVDEGVDRALCGGRSDVFDRWFCDKAE